MSRFTTGDWRRNGDTIQAWPEGSTDPHGYDCVAVAKVLTTDADGDVLAAAKEMESALREARGWMTHLSLWDGGGAALNDAAEFELKVRSILAKLEEPENER